MRKGGEFDPPSTQGTILFPGMDGGGEWGGTAYDPKSGFLYVNANEMAWKVKLAERKMPDGEADDGQGAVRALLRVVPSRRILRQPARVPVAGRTSASDATWTRSTDVVRDGAGRMPGHPELHRAVRRAIVDYVVTGRSDEVRGDAPTPFDVRYTLDGYIRFTDPDGFPAITPPWGTLTAIDMNRAAIAWQVPLGEVPGSGLTNTGSENYGGPVVTASGLLFIGATNYDKKFRAFDARTGKVLVGNDASRGGQRDACSVRSQRQAVRGHRRRRRKGGMLRQAAAMSRLRCRDCPARARDLMNRGRAHWYGASFRRAFLFSQLTPSALLKRCPTDS